MKTDYYRLVMFSIAFGLLILAAVVALVWV